MNVPTIRQLECFVAVSDTLNFRLAADRCFITQPALSAQVQQLEQLLGTQLFERNRRSVLPTAAGTALVDGARRILSDLNDLTESAQSFGSPLTGTLRIGVIPTVAPYVLPAAMAHVAKRHPKLRILLREGQTEDLVTALHEGSLDVLLLALEADLRGATTMELRKDTFVLAVPPNHRLHQRKRVRMSDLAGEQVLLLEDGHCLRTQTLPLCTTAGACEVGDFRASSLTTLVQMVAAGVGVTLLPEMSIAAEALPTRDLGIVPIAGGPSRTIGLCWRPTSMRTPEFRLLGETIRSGTTP